MKGNKEIVAPIKPTIPYFRTRPKPAPLINHASKLYQKIPSPFRTRHRKPSAHPHHSGQEKEHQHQHDGHVTSSSNNNQEKRGATPTAVETAGGPTQELAISNTKIKTEAGGGGGHHHGDLNVVEHSKLLNLLVSEKGQPGELYDSGSGPIPPSSGSGMNYEKVFMEVMRQPSSRRAPNEIYNSHGFLPGANQQQNQQQLPPGPGPGPDNTNSMLFKNTRTTIKQSNVGLTNRNNSQPRIKSDSADNTAQLQQQQQQKEILARHSQHQSEIIEPGHNSPKILYTKSSNWEADTSITHSEMEQDSKMKHHQISKAAVVVPSRSVRNDAKSKLTKSKTTKNQQQIIKKPFGFGFGTDVKSHNSSLVNKTKRISPMIMEHSSTNLNAGSRSPSNGASRTFVYNEQGHGHELKSKSYSVRSPSMSLVADVATKNNSSSKRIDENISARETIYVPLHPTEQPYALKVSTGTSDSERSLISSNPNKYNTVPKKILADFVNNTNSGSHNNERRSRNRSIRSIKRDNSARTNRNSHGPPPPGAGTRTGLRLSDMQLKAFTESTASVRSQRFGGLKSWKPQQQPWNSQLVNERAIVTNHVVHSGTQANLIVTLSPPAPHGTIDVNSTTVGISRGQRSAFGTGSSKPKPPKHYPPDHEKFETLSSRNKKTRRYFNNFIKRPKYNKVPQIIKSISAHRIQTQTEESSLKADQQQVTVTITNHPATIPISNPLKHRASKQHVLKSQQQPHAQLPADHLAQSNLVAGSKKMKSPTFKSPGAAGVISDVIGAGATSSPLGNSNNVRPSDSKTQSASSHKKQKPVKSKTSVKTTSSKKTRRHSTTVTIIGELSKLQKSKLPIIWVFGYTQISIVDNVIKILNGISNHLNYYLIDLDKEIASWTDSNTFQQQQRAQFEGPADDDDELLQQKLLQRQLLLLQSQSENQVSDQHTSENQNKNESQNRTTPNTPHAFKSKSKTKGLNLTFKDDIIIQAAKILTKVVGMVNKYLETDDILELITLAMIRAQVEEDPKPKGYIIKNFPLFAAEGEAFENYLYEVATGIYMLPESEADRIQNGHLVETQRYFMREQEYNEMAVRDAVDKIGGKYPVQIYVPSDENSVMRQGKLKEIIYLVQSRMEMLHQIQQAKSQNQLGLLNTAGVTGVQQLGAFNNGTSDGGGNRGKSKLGNKNSNSNNRRNKEDTISSHSHSPSVRTANNLTAKKVKSRNNTSHTINNAKKNEF